MASNLLGNLVNYSDEDDDSDSEIQPQTQPTSQSQNQSANKRKPDTPIDDLNGSNTKKPPTSTVHIHKPAARPASLPASAPPKPVHHTPERHRVTSPMDEDEDEQRRKMLLKPEAIPGVDNWGIPPELSGDCDPDVEARIEHFLSLRETGTRFNEHLQHSKAFRNPHIYEKLVEFVELDEYSSNFPKEQFDPHGLGTDIEGLLEAQKKVAEEKALAQQNRTNIQFVSSEKPPPVVPGNASLSMAQQSDKFADAVARAARIASKLSSQAPKRD